MIAGWRTCGGRPVRTARGKHVSATPEAPPPPDERRRRFEQVYAAHRAGILGYALRRTADPQDAADVLAETFLIAWRRLEDVPHGGTARLWLYGVARRVLANHHRGERRRSALVDGLAGQLRIDLTAHRAPRWEGEEAAIAAAFGELSENDRELLSLVGWEALDHAEIAAVLGCSRNAVRIRLHRARRRFARALDRHGARTPHTRALSAAVITGEHT